MKANHPRPSLMLFSRYTRFSRYQFYHYHSKKNKLRPDIAWYSQYPQSTPDVNSLPKAWTDALSAAVSAGKIPDIPVPTMSSSGSPAYPAGTNRNDASVCAATDRECRIPGNIWDAPDGMIGIGFDDGPTPVSFSSLKYISY